MSALTQERTFRAGLVQMRSGCDVRKNVADADRLIRQAAAQGALYIQTPEVTTLMELDRARLFAETKPEAGNPCLQRFCDTAQELAIWLHIGSMGVMLASGRIANRSYLITPNGRVAARYDKIHMFDVDLGNGERYAESANYEAGSQAVVAMLPWGAIGLAICYDLRFPYLFRSLAKGGACFLALPAAFTRATGIVHWHTLLKARAIECQCFLFAAAQGGRHEHGRETYGHSLIVSPWGEILGEGGTDPVTVVADIDLQLLEDVRRRLPSLTHDRPFELTRTAPMPAEAAQ